jgi:thiol:disulfide interchange protein DsbC
MTRLQGLILALVACQATAASAADRKGFPGQDSPELRAVAEELAKTLPNTGIDGVRETPIPGLVEITAGEQIFYFSPGGYLIFGEIFTREGKSLTADRRRELVAKKLGQIDLTKALTVGSGPHQVIEFTDPDCPYCRRTDAFLSGRTDITRHIFFFPLPMHKDAAAKSRYILCHQDPERALREVFAGAWDQTPLPDSFTNCQTNLDSQMRIGASLGVRGTPTIWVNGTAISGADTKTLAELLGRNP